MSDAVWVIEGGRVALRASTGEITFPSALEIFQAVYGRSKKTDLKLALQSPAEAFPWINFSREPAVAAWKVHYDQGNVRASLGVLADDGFAPIELEVDQLLRGANWYPIHLSSLRDAYEWAASLGAMPGVITVGALVALRASSVRPCAFLDDVTASASSIADAAGATNGSIEGLNAELYDYQKAGVGFLSLVATQGVGCILGDEMGLGKTLQIIALLQRERNAGRGASLVIAPATLLLNWQREIALFAPQLTVLLHAGPSRAGIAAKLGLHDVTLMSYETAIRDEVLLSGVAWNVLALDEAQNIKNPEAQRTLAVKRLSRRVSVAITGTPMENRLEDLWSITDFALPGLLGELKDFQGQFGNGTSDAARLAPVVAPVLLRRLVADVAHDLPEKIEIPQALEMTPMLADQYEQIRVQALAEHGPAGGLVAASRLRMLCAHPSLVMPWHGDPADEMPKYARTLELLEEVFANGEKALVFSTYQGMADLFMADVPQRFLGGFFRSIDGRVAVPERQKIVDDFFGFGGFGALFLNPKAAGSGLNITAANHVIHYNNEWNPALTAQASARAFRRKQTRPVTIHHLFFVNTVEEVVRDASLFKQSLAENAVTGHEGGVNPLQIARALQISPLAVKEEHL